MSTKIQPPVIGPFLLPPNHNAFMIGGKFCVESHVEGDLMKVFVMYSDPAPENPAIAEKIADILGEELPKTPREYAISERGRDTSSEDKYVVFTAASEAMIGEGERLSTAQMERFYEDLRNAAKAREADISAALSPPKVAFGSVASFLEGAKGRVIDPAFLDEFRQRFGGTGI